MSKQAGIPERCCINCAFLSGEARRLVVKPLEPEIRRAVIETDDPGTLLADNRCHCKRQVWIFDTGDLYEQRKEKGPELVSRDRGESCFFYPYRDNISSAAAEELEKREAERREADRDRALTRENADSAKHTAWAAILVAIVASAVSLASFAWTVRCDYRAEAMESQRQQAARVVPATQPSNTGQQAPDSP